MSDLASTYALQVGVRIDKPSIQEAFFPLDHPLDKVILIHGFGGALINGNQATFPAKVYDAFGEVVDLLRPVVEPLGYRLYQIGAPGEPPIRGLEHLQGKTTLHQCTYLVKRAALLIGNDSLWAHERGAFGGALVALYGPTSVKVHGPHWKDPAKTVLIESHRFGKKPSYQAGEQVKTINVIPPESVANAALKLLGLPALPIQSLLIGANYNQSLCEIVPNFVPSPQLGIANPVLRFDYHFDAALIAQNLAVRRCAIIANAEFDLAILAPVRQNVALIKLELNERVSVAWVRQLKRLGIPLQFYTLETDEVKLKKLRLDFFDIEVYLDTFAFPTKDTFETEARQWLNQKDATFDYSRLHFKTLKVLLSEGKIYSSNAHRLAGVAAESVEKNGGAIIDNEMFWRETSHHYYFYP